MWLRAGIFVAGAGMIAISLLFPKPTTFSPVVYLFLLGIGVVFWGIAVSIAYWIEHDLTNKVPA